MLVDSYLVFDDKSFEIFSCSVGTGFAFLRHKIKANRDGVFVIGNNFSDDFFINKDFAFYAV